VFLSCGTIKSGEVYSITGLDVDTVQIEIYFNKKLVHTHTSHNISCARSYVNEWEHYSLWRHMER